MTAINTNTAVLNAQYYLAKTNKEMEGTMAKLSSGSKVNSAADDAAGLAIQPYDCTDPRPWHGS